MLLSSIAVMKYEKTSEPSMPFHINASYGILFVSFQLIFEVTNLSMPLFFIICGIAAL